MAQADKKNLISLCLKRLRQSSIDRNDASLSIDGILQKDNPHACFPS